MNYFGNKNSLLLESFSYWQNRKLYLQLMENFVYERIDVTQFDTEFYRMWEVDRDKTYNSEEVVYITENVKLTEIDGVSSLISDLFLDCELFQPDSALRKDYEISEEELRNRVKKTLLEIKDRYP